MTNSQTHAYDYYASRSAFVLNANAKSVSDKVVNRLAELIPAGDLFYSRSMKESEHFYETILRRGYSRVFSGGGDGTLVNAINTLQRLTKNLKLKQLPAVGILRLGTGNAVASLIGAKDPWTDTHHVVQGGAVSTRPINMVHCDDGSVAPFASVGYDGEVLNDYVAFKKSYAHKPGAKWVSSVLGYLWAGITRTLPRRVMQSNPKVRVYSNETAYKMVHEGGKDSEVVIPAGTTLYEGPACAVSVGSIPCYGYGFAMFPFAQSKAGHIQLRICNMSLIKVLAYLYPSLWRGTYRQPDLLDFMIKDVVVDCIDEMPYQIGGDAAGYRRRLSFSVAPNVVEMAELAPQRLAMPRGIFGFLPAPVLARS